MSLPMHEILPAPLLIHIALNLTLVCWWKFELQDLSPDGLKSFLDAKGVPLVVEMNKDPANHAALVKFFNGVGTKVSSAEPHIFP